MAIGSASSSLTNLLHSLLATSLVKTAILDCVFHRWDRQLLINKVEIRTEHVTGLGVRIIPPGP